MPRFPELTVQPNSNLSFPWAEFITRQGSSMNWSLGSSGVTMAMVILIYFEDLEDAVQQLLGYSYRDSRFATPRLGRVLPWRHPYWVQMWCSDIVNVQGIKWINKQTIWGEGPYSEYEIVALTLRFTRPNYAILSDADIVVSGSPNEWLRFTDRFWKPSINVLSREGMTYTYTQGTASGNQFPGSVGQRLPKLRLSRTWYQIPEQCVLDANGFPSNLATSPTTQYGAASISSVAAGGAGYAVNDYITLDGGTYNWRTVLQVTTVAAGAVTAASIYVAGKYTVTPGNPVAQASTTGSGTGATFNMTWSTLTQPNLLGSVNDSTFFGSPAGTLLYDSVEITPRPLHLPPRLMQIVGENYQQQYDITFSFEFFDPPRGNGVTNRGHNLMPWASDGLWYPVGSAVGRLPPFQSEDFTKLWQVL